MSVVTESRPVTPVTPVAYRVTGRRLPVLWSKTAVYGVVAALVAAAGAVVAFLIVGAVVSGTPAAMYLSGDGVVRSLLGAGLYLGLVAVIGVALGVLLRSVAGGI